MERKLTKEELAQNAIEYLDQAELFEENNEWYKAIEYYQKAADLLQESGYLTHRIQDIYTRVTEINSYLKQQKAYNAAQAQIQQAKQDQLQDEAFALLDQAKKREESGPLNEVISIYMSAIKLLTEAGWTETQLENLKSKIIDLAHIQEQQSQITQEQNIQLQPQYMPTTPTEMVTPVYVDKKAIALRAFEEKKKQEEDLQKQAFSYMDKAKEFEKNREYDNAIFHYQKAVEILNSLGWIDQTHSIITIIKKLNSEREKFKDTQLKSSSETSSIQQKLHQQPIISQSEIDFKKQKLIEFENKKKEEERKQKEAFELIDLGNKYEREGSYDVAISSFEQAIELFNIIGWDTYIEPLVKTINTIKEKEQREIKARQNQIKREGELDKIQNMIQKKQVETIEQSREFLEIKRIQFEKQRMEQQNLENQFYSILDQADKSIKDFDYDNAINFYNRALNMIQNMGVGWESYTQTIQNTISTIQQKKQLVIAKQVEEQRIKEERKQNEMEFQQQMVEKLSKGREVLKQRQIELKEQEEELKYRQQRKQSAFKYLEAGQKYLREGDLEKAIYAYQNANNVFAEIQWVEEVPLIENIINEIQRKKNEIINQEEKKLKEWIENQKKEIQFQKQIEEQLNIEKEKISQNELSLITQKEKLRIFEERKRNTFNLLEEAENQLKFGRYEKAIELYQEAESILTELRFPTNIIKETIQKVIEKKKEHDLLKQQENQSELQKQRENKEFQQKIIENVNKEQYKLQLKQIDIKKREQRQLVLERRKEEAFNILEQAENLTTIKDYDKALELYRNAELLLNQLHFPTDLIKETIINVTNLKKGKDLERKTELQKEIEEFEEEKKLQELIRERQKQRTQEVLAKQLANQEREHLIQAQMNARETAYALFEEAGNYLKKYDPDYEKGISLYMQAKTILEQNVGWEPEINNINRAINDLQQEKTIYLEKKRLEAEERRKRQQEYIAFEQEIKRKNREYEIQREEQRLEFERYNAQKRMSEELKEKAFKILDDAKNMAKMNQFNEAYDLFYQAKSQFKEMGWDQHIHFIEAEINNTKQIEQIIRQEETELQKIRQALNNQVKIEAEKRETEERKLRASIGEIGELAGDVTKLIQGRKKELILERKNQDHQIKEEAKEFSRNMARMLSLKQDILSELKKKEGLIKEQQEQKDKQKQRKEVDDIARMIKEAAKKK